MSPIQTYIRQGRHTLRRWVLDPRIHKIAQVAAYILTGFGLSAAGLGQAPMPLALALVVACSRWQGFLAAIGGCLGYLVFWKQDAWVCMAWVLLGLLGALALGSLQLRKQAPLLLPAVSGLIVAVCGVVAQLLLKDRTPVLLYLLQVALAVGASWLFGKVLEGRNPILDWLACGLGVLALAQIMPIPYLGLGYVAGGMLVCAGSFPAAALAGLALDLAQVTPVPMTAVMTCAYLVRLLPRCSRWLLAIVPCSVYISIMSLWGRWDMYPIAGLLIGGIAGVLLPGKTRSAYRRGETGVAQVRLEMAAGVLTQTKQLLLEVPVIDVDEDALVSRAAQRACGGCPYRKSCKDISRIACLSGVLLHKELLHGEELPITCRKSGRFLAELHRSQEQLSTIRADRQRQQEYRSAVMQQYDFLADFLQSLSDQLARKNHILPACYTPMVFCCGNRPAWENGDRCLRFAGVCNRYYVILCDGMGTGMGAVQEGKTASAMLRRMLTAGYPACHALRSINSLCALRERAGAVAVDLLELQLDTGKAALYKWGAAPSYLLTDTAVQKIGVSGPPPGLSVTDETEMVEKFSLRKDQILLLVSDGVPEETAMRCCMENKTEEPEELAKKVLSCTLTSGQDDATVIAVALVDC